MGRLGRADGRGAMPRLRLRRWDAHRGVGKVHYAVTVGEAARCYRGRGISRGKRGGVREGRPITARGGGDGDASKLGGRRSERWRTQGCRRRLPECHHAVVAGGGDSDAVTARQGRNRNARNGANISVQELGWRGTIGE